MSWVHFYDVSSTETSPIWPPDAHPQAQNKQMKLSQEKKTTNPKKTQSEKEKNCFLVEKNTG